MPVQSSIITPPLKHSKLAYGHKATKLRKMGLLHTPHKDPRKLSGAEKAAITRQWAKHKGKIKAVDKGTRSFKALTPTQYRNLKKLGVSTLVGKGMMIKGASKARITGRGNNTTISLFHKGGNKDVLKLSQPKPDQVMQGALDYAKATGAKTVGFVVNGSQSTLTINIDLLEGYDGFADDDIDDEAVAYALSVINSGAIISGYYSVR